MHSIPPMPSTSSGAGGGSAAVAVPDLPVMPSTSAPGGPGGGGAGLRRAESTATDKQERSLLRTIKLRLQDNRLEGTDFEQQQQARQRNRAEEDASYAMLKTVLNAIFVTTGLALLISVIIVVIYTSVGKC